MGTQLFKTMIFSDHGTWEKCNVHVYVDQCSLGLYKKNPFFLSFVTGSLVHEHYTRECVHFRTHNKNLIFLFLNQKICCGYSKELSQWDGSFEHPKHMLNLMGKKIFTTLRWKNWLSKPVLFYVLMLTLTCSRSIIMSTWLYSLPRESGGDCHQRSAVPSIAYIIEWFFSGIAGLQ